MCVMEQITRSCSPATLSCHADAQAPGAPAVPLRSAHVRAANRSPWHTGQDVCSHTRNVQANGPLRSSTLKQRFAPKKTIG